MNDRSKEEEQDIYTALCDLGEVSGVLSDRDRTIFYSGWQSGRDWQREQDSARRAALAALGSEER